MFETRNAVTTLSVYCFTVTAKVYDDATESVKKVSETYYAPKQLSDSIVKAEFEKAGYTVVGKLETVEGKDKGLWKMSWKTFVEHGERVGDTRPKKEKEDK